MTPRTHPRRSVTLALTAASLTVGVAGLAVVGTSKTPVPAALPAVQALPRVTGTPDGPGPAAPTAASPAASPVTSPVTTAADGPDATQVSGTTLTGARVPAGFLALSVEAQAVADGSFSVKTPGLVGLLSGLHLGFLRVGASTGDSAPLAARSLASLAQLSAAADLPVVLQLPFRPDDPAAGTAEAVTAAADLGQGLEAFEIGNEPDTYGSRGIRRGRWDYATFVTQRDAYRDALVKAGLRVPLWGPDDSGSGWLGATVAEHERPYAVITQHFYPLSRCRPPQPTIPALLSDAVHAKEQSEAELLAEASRSSKLPVAVDESNSVSCYGGQPGVSNTAASALWALDYGLVMAQAGVGAVAFHVPLSGCVGYTPLCLVGSGSTRRWVASPEYDGLSLLGGLVGDRFTAESLTSVHHHLRTYALTAPTGAVVLVVLDLDPTGRGTAHLLWQHSAASAAITQIGFQTPDYAGTETGQITTGTTAPPATAAGTAVNQVLPLTPGTAAVFSTH